MDEQSHFQGTLLTLLLTIRKHAITTHSPGLVTLWADLVAGFLLYCPSTAESRPKFEPMS